MSESKTMDVQLLSELKQLIADYETPCTECEESKQAAGHLSLLKGEDLFAPDLLTPKREWFEVIPDEVHDLPVKKINIWTNQENPNFGRVAGRIADFDQCILDGSKECWTAPKIGDYSLLYQGITELDDGTEIATCDLAITEGHAPQQFFQDWEMALAFNLGEIDRRGEPIPDPEKVESKVARVRLVDGPDGVYVLGAVYPTARARTVVLAKGTPWSGHWQTIPGKGMQLLGAVPVNLPGLPQFSKVATNTGYAVVMAAADTPELTDTTVPEQAPNITELIARVQAIEEWVDNQEEWKAQIEQLIAADAMDDVSVDPLPDED